MDPLTLFAIANGAVAAVKKGCALYKEIQGAASDVKGVLQDLDEQFKTRHKDKPPSIAEKNQYIEEKNRVIELSKKQPDDVFTEIYNWIGCDNEDLVILDYVDWNKMPNDKNIINKFVGFKNETKSFGFHKN